METDVRYRNHNSPPYVPIQSQTNPAHVAPSHSWRRSILIFSSHLRLGLPGGLFSSGIPTKTLYAPLIVSHRSHISRPSASCWFCHQDIWWAVQVMKLLIVPYAPVPCHFPVRPKCLPQHPILEHPQSKFRTQRDRPTSHPYTKAGKRIVLYT